MDKKSLDQLRGQGRDWNAIFLGVFKAARVLATRYGWNERTSLPDGEMLEDLVIGAIEELWVSPEKIRNDIRITTQLANIVRRKLSNLSKKSDAAVKRCDEVAFHRADDIALDDAIERDYDSRMDDLFEKAISLLRLHPKIKGKDEHELVLMAIEEGAMKPRDISELTELPVKRVYQITREIESTYPSIAEMLVRIEARTNE